MGVVGKPHLYAQQRLVNIINARGYEASMEVPNPLPVDNGRKKIKVLYVYDVYFPVDDDWAVDIEVDGKFGHSTTQALSQDKHRDLASVQKPAKGPRVISIRLLTGWIVGPKALTSDDIWEEIVFRCKEFNVEVPVLK